MLRTYRAILTLLTLGALLALAPRLAAQQPPTADGSQQPNAAPATAPDDNLKLTPDQKSQIKAIRQSEKQQIEAIRDDSSLTQEQREQQIRQLRHSSKQQIYKLLTPEQRQAWRQRRQERRENRLRRNLC